MGSIRRSAALAVAFGLVLAACSGGASPSPLGLGRSAERGPERICECGAGHPVPGGLLDKIMKAGKFVVSTAPKYPPQSELQPDGTFKGFDIDVATEIAKRLGVKVEFATPDWTAITAGSWGGRWDMSVGSMAITIDRAKVLDFSPPYYGVPVQLTASVASGITTIAGLAGKTICSGLGTTYDQWLNGTLDFGTGQDLGKPPAGIKTTTLSPGSDCPVQWKAGRNDFQGWLSASTEVDAAIKAGLPVVKVGDPVYSEPLGIAVDKSGPADADFVAALKKIVDDMHADGTLKAFSMTWFGADFTTVK